MIEGIGRRRNIAIGCHAPRSIAQGVESGRINGARQEREEADFNHALKAGEMPRLRPLVFTTDYNPGDISALLDRVELLDVNAAGSA